MRKFIGLLLISVMLLGCATSTQVNINTNVPDANVVLDGKQMGKTPIKQVKVKNNASRSYQVVIEKEGYKTYTGYLQKEDKPAAIAAVVIGYCLIWTILPAALLLLYIPAMQGPVPDQYFVLEEAK
jgi:hypothetical protein